MRRIEVDDEVYAYLEGCARGFDRPNDVLRRLLIPASTEVLVDRRERGRLMPLVEGGLVRAGDQVAHERPRKGDRFEGEIDELGRVVTMRGTYSAPSPALAALVGSQIDGWAFWRHVPTGETLRALRARLESDGS